MVANSVVPIAKPPSASASRLAHTGTWRRPTTEVGDATEPDNATPPGSTGDRSQTESAGPWFLKDVSGDRIPTGRPVTGRTGAGSGIRARRHLTRGGCRSGGASRSSRPTWCARPPPRRLGPPVGSSTSAVRRRLSHTTQAPHDERQRPGSARARARRSPISPGPDAAQGAERSHSKQGTGLSVALPGLGRSNVCACCRRFGGAWDRWPPRRSLPCHLRSRPTRRWPTSSSRWWVRALSPSPTSSKPYAPSWPTDDARSWSRPPAGASPSSTRPRPWRADAPEAVPRWSCRRCWP